MLQAGEDSELEGFIAGPFSIRIGPHLHEADFQVAPLKERMLLGLDVLSIKKIQLNLDSVSMELSNEPIMMTPRHAKCTPLYPPDAYWGYDAEVGRVPAELEPTRLLAVGASNLSEVR